MSKIQDGSKISVHYKGTLSSGEEFDNSYNRGESLTFTVGAGQMISGFDRGVVGMEVGESKSITINPEQAYGIRNEEAIQEVPKSQFPGDFNYGVGTSVQGVNPDGGQITAIIMSEQADTVTLDFNHPLASKTLNFEVEIMSIED
jgi:FKBP-type peptidyl-prolyl cis-trans isomerase 2